ncbi:MAG: hypothetical protein CFE43_11730 [Burkholderiales bacterium PBB3]|nr:MAG: hypothetical protein CFE43_11730 [Burkholderiales bacterium PBB3]
MSQNPTPATPTTQPAESVDAASRASAAKALLEELQRKTQQVILDNPDVIKGLPGGITGITQK